MRHDFYECLEINLRSQVKIWIGGILAGDLDLDPHRDDPIEIPASHSQH